MLNVVYLRYVPLYRCSFQKWAWEGLDYLGDAGMERSRTKFLKSRGWATTFEVFFLFSHESSPVHSHNADLICSKTERRCIHPRPNSHHSQAAQQHDASSNFPTGSHTHASAQCTHVPIKLRHRYARWRHCHITSGLVATPG